MLDHPAALKNPPLALAAFCESGDIALAHRLGVYRNNIVGSLTDVMLASFPVIEKLVGKDFLEKMARSFILRNPPQQGCLMFYGEGFAEFIATFEPARTLPYLPDVARFELALNRAYYAVDDRPLRAETLGDIPPSALVETRLALRDSVQFLRSDYPLTAIQDFCHADAQEQAGSLNLDQGDEALMIYRPALETRVVSLAGDEDFMLRAMAGGAVLGRALEETLGRFEQFDVQKFLEKHLALETFRDF